jgi:hypothetical protein
MLIKACDISPGDILLVPKVGDVEVLSVKISEDGWVAVECKNKNDIWLPSRQTVLRKDKNQHFFTGVCT